MSTDALPAITIRPPWSQIIAETAALTALGIPPKTIENRGRPIAAKHIDTDVAIHAGLTWCPFGGNDPNVIEAWAGFAMAIRLREPNPKLAAIGDTRTGFVGALKPGLWIERGAVVAVARLVDCHPAEQMTLSRTCCWPWGQATHNGKPAFHLVLDDVRRLRDPVPARGSLAVPWTLPADVAAEVQRQLADLPIGASHV